MIYLIINNAVAATFGVLFALASRNVINDAVGGRDSFVKGLMILAAIVIAQIILSCVGSTVEMRIQAKLEILFRTRLMNTIMQKDYTAVTAFHSGEMQNRLTSDVGIVSDGVTSFLPMLVGMITRLSVALAALIFIDRFFAFVFLFAGLFFIVINQFLRPLMKKMHKRVLEADGKVRSFFQEILESLLMVKVFGIQEKTAKRSDALQQVLYREKMRRRTINILANTGLSVLWSAGNLYTIAWGAYHLYQKTMSYGTFMAILQLVGQIMAPSQGLSGLLPRYYSIIASTERLMEIEDLPDEKNLNEMPSSADETASKDETLSTEQLYQKLDAIVISDLTFQYNRDILYEQSNLTIQKGDFAVIAGFSGIGKSTLFKLLLGVISPQSGSIRFKTTDGQSYLADQTTRSLFAYVPQGNLLISGTIREAVSFVKCTVTDEDIMKAAKIACADGFINEFPEKLDTRLGENGKGLSEGQLQRLSIMRAILSGSPILLFDEATSALDETTEEQLLSHLKEMQNITCIVISHKKAAFLVCNKEIVIENKKIITKEHHS